MSMKPNEIRAEMVRKKITVTSIAKELDLHQPNVSQVIYGVRPNMRIRKAIADALNMSVSDIWPEPAEE